MISFVEEWLGVFPLTHPVVEKIGFEIRLRGCVIPSPYLVV